MGIHFRSYLYLPPRHNGTSAEIKKVGMEGAVLHHLGFHRVESAWLRLHHCSTHPFSRDTDLQVEEREAPEKFGGGVIGEFGVRTGRIIGSL